MKLAALLEETGSFDNFVEQVAKMDQEASAHGYLVVPGTSFKLVGSLSVNGSSLAAMAGDDEELKARLTKKATVQWEGKGRFMVDGETHSDNYAEVTITRQNLKSWSQDGETSLKNIFIFELK